MYVHLLFERSTIGRVSLPLTSHSIILNVTVAGAVAEDGRSKVVPVRMIFQLISNASYFKISNRDVRSEIIDIIKLHAHQN